MDSKKRYACLLPLVFLAACGDREPEGARQTAGVGPCAIALAPSGADESGAIARLQRAAREAADPAAYLERLGWAYVSKARHSFDDGFYRLAEQSALCLESKVPESPEAQLLRGHVLHQLHRFREAEALARRLVEGRGLHYDYALLGDVVMEQGRLDEAADAYQEMIDQRPSPQAYGRVAYLRFLEGDVGGARELMEMAVRAQGPRDREAAAWSYVRLAHYELLARDFEDGRRSLERALTLQPEYPPALLAKGRLFLAEGRPDDAVDALERAAAGNPLPEYRWALLEALAASGDESEADSVSERLLESGASDDPRLLSLFLATRGAETERARRLAELELDERADVFTLDAVAWALHACGRAQEARPFMERALREGTRDARLFLHAGVIARSTGRRDEARRWLAEASDLETMLLPSERERLRSELAATEPQNALAESPARGLSTDNH